MKIWFQLTTEGEKDKISWLLSARASFFFPLKNTPCYPGGSSSLWELSLRTVFSPRWALKDVWTKGLCFWTRYDQETAIKLRPSKLMGWPAVRFVSVADVCCCCSVLSHVQLWYHMDCSQAFLTFTIPWLSSKNSKQEPPRDGAEFCSPWVWPGFSH